MKDITEVTLLLVEDDDVDAMSIERGFMQNRLANTIVRARDGIEALALMRNDTVSKPYVVLLDLKMPRMNGFEFLDKVRKDEKLHDAVVFVLTTSKSESDIASSYDKNIAGYFIKDDAGQQFLDVVSMLEGYWKVVCLPA